MPRLSVVISTLGMHASLERVLAGYERQEADRDAFEVVVAVDRADPEPETVDRLLEGRSYPASRVTGRIPGLSANRNAGWRAAASPLVLFTDNDTIPSPDLVSQHLAWHRHNPGDEVAVLGHVRWAPELRTTVFMRWLDRGIQFDYPNIKGVDAGWGRFYGANVSVKRALLQRVGGFEEERLPYGYEDLDWARRAADEGLRVLYNRDAVVDHLRPMTLEFWQRRARRVAVAELQFVRMHPDVQPHFHRLFTRAASQPRASGRGRHLAPAVPRWIPWLGPKVWMSVDRYYKQQIAPYFLAAWDEAAAGGIAEGPVQPDVSERDASASAADSPRARNSAGSPPGGPK